MPRPPKWTLVEVKKSEVLLNPNNPKVRDQNGFKRLQLSLKRFGRIFDGIANKDLSLIDGHSRIEALRPSSKIRLFVPSRQLTPTEYIELYTMFDVALAGKPDMKMVFEALEDLPDTDKSEWYFEDPNDAKEDAKTAKKPKHKSKILKFYLSPKDYNKVVEKLQLAGDSYEDALLHLLDIK